jgi:hypothetical protein
MSHEIIEISSDDESVVCVAKNDSAVRSIVPSVSAASKIHSPRGTPTITFRQPSTHQRVAGDNRPNGISYQTNPSASSSTTAWASAQCKNVNNLSSISVSSKSSKVIVEKGNMLATKHPYAERSLVNSDDRRISNDEGGMKHSKLSSPYAIDLKSTRHSAIVLGAGNASRQSTFTTNSTIQNRTLSNDVSQSTRESFLESHAKAQPPSNKSVGLSDQLQQTEAFSRNSPDKNQGSNTRNGIHGGSRQLSVSLKNLSTANLDKGVLYPSQQPKSFVQSTKKQAVSVGNIASPAQNLSTTQKVAMPELRAQSRQVTGSDKVHHSRQSSLPLQTKVLKRKLLYEGSASPPQSMATVSLPSKKSNKRRRLDEADGDSSGSELPIGSVSKPSYVVKSQSQGFETETQESSSDTRRALRDKNPVSSISSYRRVCELSYLKLSSRYSYASLLRHRELDDCFDMTSRSLLHTLREYTLNTQLTPWKSWTGASKDVITAAWNPDGSNFLVGASTDLDELNLNYNRSNNLLWADIEEGYLVELDDHNVPRPLPSAGSQGNPANMAAYNTLDPRVFTTVSAVVSAVDEDCFFTGSYDNTVKIWDNSIKGKAPICVGTVPHNERVELLSVYKGRGNLIASAENSTQDSITLFEVASDYSTNVHQKIDIKRSQRYDLYPTTLAWGFPASSTEHLLLMGFGDRGIVKNRDKKGDILLWDVSAQSPSSQMKTHRGWTFDCVWHHQIPLVTAAMTPGRSRSHEKGTQTVIKTWAPLENSLPIREFDCPAMDVNEIVFNPVAEYYISAACTDGTVYIWDSRRQDEIYATLRHGFPIEELNLDRSREEQDTGVKFISWNPNGSLLYTGSSDGMVKQWNPFIAEEDAFIQDIASYDSGVMTGTFSPDFTNLLIGLCKGSIHTLSSSPVCDPGVETSFNFSSAASRKEPPLPD